MYSKSTGATALLTLSLTFRSGFIFGNSDLTISNVFDVIFRLYNTIFDIQSTIARHLCGTANSPGLHPLMVAIE
jgi:hypothetical protein